MITLRAEQEELNNRLSGPLSSVESERIDARLRQLNVEINARMTEMATSKFRVTNFTTSMGSLFGVSRMFHTISYDKSLSNVPEEKLQLCREMQGDFDLELADGNSQPIIEQGPPQQSLTANVSLSTTFL